MRVESSKKRLTTVRPRRAGSFLIGRSASERISSAVARTSSASSRVRSAALQQVALHRAPPRFPMDRDGVDRRRCRSRLTRTRSTSEVGRFLPTKSARIGSSRWPRSTRTASWTALRPAHVVQRVERGADRAAGEEHVVDQHDDLAVDAAGAGSAVGSRVRAGLRRRSSRYIVTSSDPTGTATPSTAAIRSAIRSASGTPRDGMPSRTRSSAPLVALEDLVGDAGQGPGDVTGVEDGAAEWSVSSRMLAGRLGAHVRPDLLLRLTGRLVKGCRSGVTLQPVPRVV